MFGERSTAKKPHPVSLLEGGLLLILIDDMIFLSPFLDVTRMKDVYVNKFLSSNSQTLDFSTYRMLFFDL